MLNFFKKIFLKIISGIRNSLSGFFLAYKNDNSFKLEALSSIPLILFIFLKDITLQKKIILFSTIIIVLAFELLNTAIEKSIDALSNYQKHPLLKIAKDAASCSVFFIIILSIIVWFYVLTF